MAGASCPEDHAACNAADDASMDDDVASLLHLRSATARKARQPAPLTMNDGQPCIWSTCWDYSQDWRPPLEFEWQQSSNGAPAGCVKYNDGRVIWVDECFNQANCGTTDCNGYYDGHAEPVRLVWAEECYHQTQCGTTECSGCEVIQCQDSVATTTTTTTPSCERGLRDRCTNSKGPPCPPGSSCQHATGYCVCNKGFCANSNQDWCGPVCDADLEQSCANSKGPPCPPGTHCHPASKMCV